MCFSLAGGRSQAALGPACPPSEPQWGRLPRGNVAPFRNGCEQDCWELVRCAGCAACSTSPNGERYRRPSAAVLKAKDADAKHRLWRSCAPGEGQGLIESHSPPPPNPLPAGERERAEYVASPSSSSSSA